MGSQFKYTIEDKSATLEEYITPIPTIVLYHIVCFSLDPNIKTDKRNATKPSVNRNFVRFHASTISRNNKTSWHGQLSKDLQELGNS